MKMNTNKSSGLIHQTHNSENGIALILVLGILAVLAVLATTFAFNMRLEQKAAKNYLDAVSADCIAKLGIEHAIALLHNDITDEPMGQCEGYDWNWDTWGWGEDDTGGGHPTYFAAAGLNQGINLDDYIFTQSHANFISPPPPLGLDANWINVEHNGNTIGRYAVLVIDEASKMNINMAGNIASGGSHGYNEGWTTAEIDLDELPDISSTDAENIVKYRYGENELPGATGAASINKDDDEYVDGTLFILRTDGIDNDGDGSIDEPGEGDDEPDEFTPWYPRDDDCPFSTIEQFKLVNSGDWDSVKNLIAVHSRVRNQYWDGSDWEPKLNINAAADVSEFSTPLTGVSNKYQKACNIIDYRDENIILSSINSAGWIYGVEPILINEVLANSYKNDITTYTGTLDGTSSGLQTYSGLAPNTCYRVTIDTSTYDAGEFTVTIGTATQTVNNASYNFPVGTDCTSDASGQLQITFEDTSPPPGIGDGVVSTVTGVRFTCAEFVELCNISALDGDKDGTNGINLAGWTITVGSKTSTIPQGSCSGPNTSVIGPGSYFILTNDPELFDYSYGATKNGTWGEAGEDIPLADMSSIPIVADRWVPGAGSKWNTQGELGDAGEGTTVDDIILTDSYDLITERAVDTDLPSGDYGSSGRIGESREKEDPTVRNDWDDNTGDMASPALTSSTMNSRVFGHTLTELYIKNSPFASIGEMSDADATIPLYCGVASGTAWTEISGNSSASDLGLIAERITIDAVRLDAETADDTNADSAGSHWNAEAPGWYYTESCIAPSGSGDKTSYWEWQKARLQPIPHILYIYGLYTNDTDTGYLDVYVADYNGTAYSFPGLPVAGGDDVEFKPSDGLKIGTIGTGDIGSDGRFAIQLVVDDSKTSKDVYFDYLLLVPQSMPGKLNINTASIEALRALPGTNHIAVANAIYSAVHPGLGAVDTPYTELGRVLDDITAAEFAPISNLISVHSDVFKIICLAQTFDPLGEVVAEKKVEVIVDRSALPSGPLRILSWKEITE
jgi:hypothetical protein